MSKTRSPNYPQLDFAEAIEKARLIYKSAHQHSISDDEIATALDYMSLNGRSMSVISAIKKYGLLVSTGEGHKISEDAFNVFELPLENKEHIESLKKMAFTPQIFVELRETYGDNLPSDQILRHYLIKNKFNPNVADEVVKNFRATIELVTQAEERYNEHMKPTALQTTQSLPRGAIAYQEPTRFTQLQNQPLFYGGGEIQEPENPNQMLKFRISSDSEATVVFKGEVTQRAIRKLIGLLNLSMDTFPDDIVLEAQQPKPIQPSLLDGESDSENE